MYTCTCVYIYVFTHTWCLCAHSKSMGWFTSPPPQFTRRQRQNLPASLPPGILACRKGQRGPPCGTLTVPSREGFSPPALWCSPEQTSSREASHPRLSPPQDRRPTASGHTNYLKLGARLFMAELSEPPVQPQWVRGNPYLALFSLDSRWTRPAPRPANSQQRNIGAARGTGSGHDSASALPAAAATLSHKYLIF